MSIRFRCIRRVHRVRCCRRRASRRPVAPQALAAPARTTADAGCRGRRRQPTIAQRWAALAGLGRDDIERYAAYRVGYHRGLDALRANGWRGSGYVRWVDPTNRGFLRCLRGLQQMAAAIGELDEADRIAVFMQQLDPSGIPADG